MKKFYAARFLAFGLMAAAVTLPRGGQAQWVGNAWLEDPRAQQLIDKAHDAAARGRCHVVSSMLVALGKVWSPHSLFINQANDTPEQAQIRIQAQGLLAEVLDCEVIKQRKDFRRHRARQSLIP